MFRDKLIKTFQMTKNRPIINSHSSYHFKRSCDLATSYCELQRKFSPMFYDFHYRLQARKSYICQFSFVEYLVFCIQWVLNPDIIKGDSLGLGQSSIWSEWQKASYRRSSIEKKVGIFLVVMSGWHLIDEGAGVSKLQHTQKASPFWDIMGIYCWPNHPKYGLLLIYLCRSASATKKIPYMA